MSDTQPLPTDLLAGQHGEHRALSSAHWAPSWPLLTNSSLPRSKKARKSQARNSWKMPPLVVQGFVGTLLELLVLVSFIDHLWVGGFKGYMSVMRIFVPEFPSGLRTWDENSSSALNWSPSCFAAAQLQTLSRLKRRLKPNFQWTESWFQIQSWASKMSVFAPET